MALIMVVICRAIRVSGNTAAKTSGRLPQCGLIKADGIGEPLVDPGVDDADTIGDELDLSGPRLEINVMTQIIDLLLRALDEDESTQLRALGSVAANMWRGRRGTNSIPLVQATPHAAEKRLTSRGQPLLDGFGASRGRAR